MTQTDLKRLSPHQEAHRSTIMRKTWIDHLRILAVLGVVGTHVSNHFYVRYGEISAGAWWTANIVDTSLKFAVPLFVMLSGSLLLGRNESLGSFYQRRALRLLPAILFWNAVYVAFALVTRDMPVSDAMWLLKGGILIKGQTYYHLWYLSMFSCLMVFAPYLNLFVRGKAPSETDLQVLVALLLIFAAAHQASIMLEETEGVRIEWFSLFVWYVGYFVLGYYLDRHAERIRLSNVWLVLAIIGVVLLGAGLNYAAAEHLGVVRDYFVMRNEGPFVFVLTVLIFALYRKNADRLKSSALITALADSGFGIYLLHVLYLELLRRAVPAYEHGGIAYLPAMIVVVVLASFLTVHVLRRGRFFRLVT